MPSEIGRLLIRRQVKKKGNPMSQNIEGKVIVITGASSGLGEATARHLAAAGAKVVLGARRFDRLAALSKELGLGEGAIVQTDVTDSAQVKHLVDTSVTKHGKIDVMINNAGLMPNSLIEKCQISDWDNVIDVNVKGVLYGIAAAFPHMAKQKSGHIINVSSVAGHKVRAGSTVYAATKAAARMLSEGLRQEVKPYNIRTTIISPGALATELPESVTDLEFSKAFKDFYEKLAVPADSFARAVALLSANLRMWISTRFYSVPLRRNFEFPRISIYCSLPTGSEQPA